MSSVDVEQMYAAESPVRLKEWNPSVSFHADQGCTQQRPDVNAYVILGKFVVMEKPSRLWLLVIDCIGDT